MSSDVGGAEPRLIGRGRDADVYALDDRRVLRRYREGGPVREEARIMAYLREHGYPVPEVFEASGDEMVLERLHGPDLLAAIMRRPWRVAAYGRMLADLHNRLHRIDAPGWLERHGEGGRMVHLDLHPLNVIVTERGPVVIDWRNARSGAPGADVADLLVVFAALGPDVSAPARAAIRLGLRRLRSAFAEAVADDPEPHMAAAVRHRLDNPTLTARERTVLGDWLTRLEAPAAPGAATG